MPNEIIRPAATVVLCKITTKWPYEILLLKRNQKSHFLPGAHVFPGGRHDENDGNLKDFLRRDQRNIQRIATRFASDEDTAVSFIAAAIRETLEEAGISILSLLTAKGRVHCDEHLLHEIISQPAPSNLTPILDDLWPISWWVTPNTETRRYNTWFFLAPVEASAVLQASSFDKEIAESGWFKPQEALNFHVQKTLFLPPPTRSIIERLATTHSLEDFLSYVDQPIWPLDPRFIGEESERHVLVLPGDPLHPNSHKSGLPLSTRFSFK